MIRVTSWVISRTPLRSVNCYTPGVLGRPSAAVFFSVLGQRFLGLAHSPLCRCDSLSVGPGIIIFPKRAVLMLLRFGYFLNCVLYRPRESVLFLAS
jgi:hypothetical protein